MDVNVATRRTSLFPGVEVDGPAQAGVRAMRRGVPRHEITERVRLVALDGAEHRGWALNISRGGVRVILEGNVALGDAFDVIVGEEEQASHVAAIAAPLATHGRIVWLQQEPDGVVAGIEFIGASGLHRALPT